MHGDYLKLVKEAIEKSLLPKLPPGFSEKDIIDIEDDLSKKDQQTLIGEDVLKESDFDFDSIINAKLKMDLIKKDNIDPKDVIRAIQFTNKVKTKKGELKNELKKDPKYEQSVELVKKYANQETGPVALRRARDLHNSNILNLVDYNIEDGTFSFDKLKAEAIIPPKSFLRKNAKMLHSQGKQFIFRDTKIAAYRGIFFNKKADKFQIVKTCPNAGSCTSDCYASKGNELKFYKSNLDSIKTLTLMLNDFDAFKQKITQEINDVKPKNKAKQLVVRFHSAGDFFNIKYLNIACEIAKENPDVDFYAYTKQINFFHHKVSGESKLELPKNFDFIFSLGGKLDEFTQSLLEKNPSLKRSIIVGNPNRPDGIWEKSELVEKINEPEYREFVKECAINAYGKPINKDKVIFYNDLVNIPYDKNNIPKEKYKVIVLPMGDGDTAAYRRDVDVVFLFKH